MQLRWLHNMLDDMKVEYRSLMSQIKEKSDTYEERVTKLEGELKALKARLGKKQQE